MTSYGSKITCQLCGNPILLPKGGGSLGGEHRRRMHFVCIVSAYKDLTKVYEETQDVVKEWMRVAEQERQAKNQAKEELEHLTRQCREQQDVIHRLQARVQEEVDRRSIPIPRPPNTAPIPGKEPPKEKEPEKKPDRFSLIEID